MEVFNWTVEKGIATDAEIVAEVEKFKEYAFFDLCVRTAARTTPEVFEAVRRLNDLLALNHATSGIKPIGNPEAEMKDGRIVKLDGKAIKPKATA